MSSLRKLASVARTGDKAKGTTLVQSLNMKHKTAHESRAARKEWERKKAVKTFTVRVARGIWDRARARATPFIAAGPDPSDAAVFREIVRTYATTKL